MLKDMQAKKGIILFMVLGMILIIVILAIVILSIISSQSRLTHHQVSRIQAYYAAQAGMNLAYENLRTGTWDYNRRYCINCTPGPPNNCIPGVPAGNIISDPDIPYFVCINIENEGVGGPNNTTAISATATYTYTP